MQHNLEVNRAVGGVDKIKRYNWKVSGRPGEFKMLSKHDLRINDEYQRTANNTKILNLAKDWSWVGCGAIVVARRSGAYWVIDGQHRVLAAMRRSDIFEMPCLVFDVFSVTEEAQGFLDLNTNRKPVSTLAKHKALVTAGNEIALFVQHELDRIGLRPALDTKTPGTIQCLGWCMKRAAADKGAFTRVLEITTEISNADAVPVRERLLDGLTYIHHNVENGLFDTRLVQRIRAKGAVCLFHAANKASAFYGKGGEKVWAEGILQEINKGLLKRFEFSK